MYWLVRRESQPWFCNKIVADNDKWEPSLTSKVSNRNKRDPVKYARKCRLKISDTFSPTYVKTFSNFGHGFPEFCSMFNVISATLSCWCTVASRRISRCQIVIARNLALWIIFTGTWSRLLVNCYDYISVLMVSNFQRSATPRIMLYKSFFKGNEFGSPSTFS